MGFFHGLVPRLTGELMALVLASTVSFTVCTYVIGDPRFKPTVKTAVGVYLLALFFPLPIIYINIFCIPVFDLFADVSVPRRLYVHGGERKLPGGRQSASHARLRELDRLLVSLIPSSPAQERILDPLPLLHWHYHSFQSAAQILVVSIWMDSKFLLL